MWLKIRGGANRGQHEKLADEDLLQELDVKFRGVSGQSKYHHPT